jgi:hypothetical protein
LKTIFSRAKNQAYSRYDPAHVTRNSLSRRGDDAKLIALRRAATQDADFPGRIGKMRPSGREAAGEWRCCGSLLQ